MMAKQTSNFGFVKPDVNEFYDVNVQNENWDKLDALLNENLNSNNATLSAHVSAKNNPHEVTAEQTGAFSSSNIEPLISELEKSIENGEVSTLQSAIQITKSSIASGQTFTGTGKGKLLVSGNGVAASPTIIIDDAEIGSPQLTSSSAWVEIEFLKNFTVKSIENNTSVFYCNAIFY